MARGTSVRQPPARARVFAAAQTLGFVLSLSGCFLFPDEDEIDFGFKGIASAETLSASVVRVKWTAATDERVLGYNVYTVSGGSKTLVTSIESPATVSYDHAGLSSGNAYSYNVQAYDEDGYEDGNTAQITAIPYAGITSASALSKETAQVVYPAAGGAASLRIYCARDGGASSLMSTEKAASGSATLKKLNPGSTYVCKVVAVASSGAEDKNTATASFSLPYAKGIALTGNAAPVAGACEGPYAVKINDQNGSAMTMSAAASVTLAASAGKLYDSSKCSSTASTVSITAAGSSAEYYFSSSATGSVTVTASHSDLPNATLSLTVAAAAASQVSIEQSGSTTTTMAGECLAFTVSIRDAYSNLAPGSTDRTVSLTSSVSTGAFYADSSCASAASSRTVSSGGSQSAFYYKQSAAGNATLSGSSTGLTTGTLALAVTAKPPSTLSLSGSGAPSVATCTAYTLSFLDSSGNSTSATSAFTASFSGAGSGAFYSSESCSSASSSSSVAVGASSATVYYKNSVSEALTLAATSSGLASGTKAISLSPGSTSQIAVSYTAPVTTGVCTTITASFKDGYGNLTPITAVKTTSISFASATGKAYSDSGCSSQITSKSSSTNETGFTVYFKDTVASSMSLTLTSSGLSDGTAIVTLIGGSLNSLSITGSQSQMPNQCSALTVTAYDAYANLPTHSGMGLTLTSTGAGAFYSDSACASAIASSSLASGIQAVTFYATDTSAQTVTFTAANGGVSVARAVTYAIGPPTQMRVSGPSVVPIGECTHWGSAFTVSVHDAYLNGTNVSSATAITFGGASRTRLHLDHWCVGTPLPAVTIANGAGSARFFLTGNWPEKVTMTADDGASGMSSTSITLTVSPFNTLDTNGIARCATLQNGRVKCWGSGAPNLQTSITIGRYPGEFGDNVPYANVGTNRIFIQQASRSNYNLNNYEFRCALLDNLDVKCWGYNEGGAQGRGTNVNTVASYGGAASSQGDNLLATDLGTNRKAYQVAVADLGGACVILDDLRVKCWGGYNLQFDYRRLGLGDNIQRGDDPGEMGDCLPTVNLGTGRTARQVRCGRAHCCAVLDDRTLKCWGTNTYGALGLGDSVSRGGGDNPNGADAMGDNLATVNLGTNRTPYSIEAGAYTSCAILDDHTLKCWGYTNDGAIAYGDAYQRGDGANEMGNCLPAINVGTGRTARRVTLAMQRAIRGPTCVLLDNETVRCWGRYNGSTGAYEMYNGHGDNITRGQTATTVGDSIPLVNLGANRTVRWFRNEYNGCAILDDYRIRCWGFNSTGALLRGDNVNRGVNPEDFGDNLGYLDFGQSYP